ncbi:hypothetical protein ABZ330_15395 [Streptomyces sp. NPDC006172]|uniref:ATP-grasp domain-containing protein n=1 Tax=Streptomyces sp. NPDC006172 TaxID=3154470 RepID=UPI0034117C0A
MTLVCLGYRGGFVAAARKRDVPLHFVVDKVRPELAGNQFTLVSDLGDAQQVLRAVREAVPKPDGAVTGNERAVFSVNVLRLAFGLPAASDFEAVIRFRDKRVQKSLLGAEVRRARCRYVSSDDTYATLRSDLGARFVLKPADGYGARATMPISSPAELEDYRRNNPTSGDVDLVGESYVQGEEFHVDGVWMRGSATWMTVSRYTTSNLSWLEGYAPGSAPLAGQQSPLDDAARAMTLRVMSDLAAPDCVFHLEGYVSEEGTVTFGEVGSRPGGPLIPETLERTYGIDLYGAAIDIALGREPAVPPSERVASPVYGCALLTRHPEDAVTESDLRARFGLDECHYPPPDKGRRKVYGHWGHAYVRGADHASVVASMRAVAAYAGGHE